MWRKEDGEKKQEENDLKKDGDGDDGGKDFLDDDDFGDPKTYLMRWKRRKRG